VLDTVFYILSFLFGASIGSFVQVVATRLNVAPVMRARSKCLSCGEALRAFDLVPLFSYIFLRGRCRHCKTSFGIDNLFVEIGFGAIYVLLYYFVLVNADTVSAVLWLVYYSLIFISLGVIALYDLKHSYVPPSFLFLFSFLSIVMLGIRYGSEGGSAALLAPFVVAFPFLAIWLATKGRALGFGDVFLFFAVGAFFGIEQGLAVLLISVWLGAIVGVGTLLLRRKKVFGSALPFVPFIVLAFLIVLFTDIDVFSIATLSL
jgi:prepilin signal peptidase PulO-like enzyme (type II secretory pathway)